MHLFRTQPLVEALAKGSLSAEERAHYLLASFLIFNFAYYSGLVVSGAAPWTPPHIAEALAVVLINIVGVVKTFDAAGGKENKQYITEFTCLYVPVSVTTLLVVWGSYWLLRIAFQESVSALANSNLQFAINMASLGFDGFALLAFVANVGCLAVTYVRLVNLHSQVKAARSDA